MSTDSPREVLLRNIVWVGVALVALTALVLVDQVGVRERALIEPLVNFTSARDGLVELAQRFATVTRPQNLSFVAVALAALLMVRGHRRAGLWVLLVWFGSALSTVAYKVVVDRDRPDLALSTLSDRAFPSGHSVGAALIVGLSLVLGRLLLRKRSQRRALVICCIAIAALVGLDRLALGVHSPTDVLGGYLWGAVWVMLGLLVFDPAARKTPAVPPPDEHTTLPGLAVILNPIKVDDVAEFQALVERRASALGFDTPQWFFTTVKDPGTSMAHDAAVGGAALVVVCGGDGTVRTVSAELAGTGVPVGVIPAGTGNLLARNLDLPLNLSAAIEVALAGQDRAIDLVRITGDDLAESHFLVMAGMGFDAAIMEGVNEQIKAKVGWLAYVVSGLRQLMFTAVKVEIQIDDQPPTHHRARTIVVGNVGFLQAGLPLLPDAQIDDGRLDVVLLNPRRFLSWLRVVVRVVGRLRKSDATVTRLTGRRIVVRASAPTPRQIDGDSIGTGHEIVCECLPGRLLVRVPR